MQTKSAFVAITGRPNAGKSSLLNAFVGEKVAIVSARPQTTRNRITGIVTIDETQLVFIDTPGIHRPKNKLGEYMSREIREGITGVDLAIMVSEPFGDIAPEEATMLENLKSRKIPVILAINKIDLLSQKELMMPKLHKFGEIYSFEHIFPISVLAGDGVGELLRTVTGYAKSGPHYFDEDAYTDQPERVIVGEMIREKLLLHLRDELPHGIAVEIDKMKERPDGSMIDISAIIYCERDSHKGMIIGKSGALLKKVATEARRDIENLLDIKVNLQCWVKVREDWRNRDGLIRSMGFK